MLVSPRPSSLSSGSSRPLSRFLFVLFFPLFSVLNPLLIATPARWRTTLLSVISTHRHIVHPHLTPPVPMDRGTITEISSIHQKNRSLPNIDFSDPHTFIALPFPAPLRIPKRFLVPSDDYDDSNGDTVQELQYMGLSCFLGLWNPFSQRVAGSLPPRWPVRDRQIAPTREPGLPSHLEGRAGRLLVSSHKPPITFKRDLASRTRKGHKRYPPIR